MHFPLACEKCIFIWTEKNVFSCGLQRVRLHMVYEYCIFLWFVRSTYSFGLWGEHCYLACLNVSKAEFVSMSF